MINRSSSSSILLTYKGKILLLSSDFPTGVRQNLWCLIGGQKSDVESFEQTIQRKIKYTTKLELKNICLLPQAPHKDKSKCFYQGELTDKDVNSIERREGQRLEFFTLVEIEKLLLTEATQDILNEYKNAIAQLFARE